jgi:protein tyrosine phosphatase
MTVDNNVFNFGTAYFSPFIKPTKDWTACEALKIASLFTVIVPLIMGIVTLVGYIAKEIAGRVKKEIPDKASLTSDKTAAAASPVLAKPASPTQGPATIATQPPIQPDKLAAPSFVELAQATDIHVIKPEISKIPPYDPKLWNKLSEETAKIKFDYLNYSQDHHNLEVIERFPNVNCPRKTAVKVEGRYLHANVVVGDLTQAHFVASQAPLQVEETLFWKAIFDKEYFIIDLSTLEDQGHSLLQHRVTKYYPEKKDETKNFGDLSVTLINEEGFYREYMILDTKTNISKKITRYHFTEWKDFSALSIGLLNDLINTLNKFAGKPIWFHCRAGVGRTGTLIIAFLLKDMIKNKIINKDNFAEKLIEIIVDLRKKRGALAVQQPPQLELLWNFGKSLLEQQ